MLLIGLTGSIATGKSTVSNLLSSPPYNLPIIDADLLARKAVEPGTWAYKRIVATFGPTTPDLLLPASDPASGGQETGPTGQGRPLNRPALGRRVFGTTPERTAARRQLNRIVHPAVRLYMLREVLMHYIRGRRAVVLDIPLLFESGLDAFVGAVVVVAVSDPQVQTLRLRGRDPHLTPDDAAARVASQTDVRDKARRALERNHLAGRGRGYVLWNDEGKEDLRVQVDELVRRVDEGSPAWWSAVLRFVPPLALCVVLLELFRGWRIQRAQRAEAGKAKL